MLSFSFAVKIAADGTNQSIHQSIIQSFIQSSNHSVNQSMNQSMNQSIRAKGNLAHVILQLCCRNGY